MIFLKDPDAVLDYQIDWSSWLGADTIAASTWSVPDGIVGTSDSNTTSTTTIWLSGGVSGVKYRLTNRIVTATARTDERSILVRVQER